MKIEKITKLYELYQIGCEFAYDFSLGKGDFRRVKISRIEIVSSIPCFRFENYTGYWPVESRLIKDLQLLGKSESFKHLKHQEV